MCGIFTQQNLLRTTEFAECLDFAPVARPLDNQIRRTRTHQGEASNRAVAADTRPLRRQGAPDLRGPPEPARRRYVVAPGFGNRFSL